jgi:hypothetical protein
MVAWQGWRWHMTTASSNASWVNKNKRKQHRFGKTSSDGNMQLLQNLIHHHISILF